MGLLGRRVPGLAAGLLATSLTGAMIAVNHAGRGRSNYLWAAERGRERGKTRRRAEAGERKAGRDGGWRDQEKERKGKGSPITWRRQSQSFLTVRRAQPGLCLRRRCASGSSGLLHRRRTAPSDLLQRAAASRRVGGRPWSSAQVERRLAVWHASGSGHAAASARREGEAGPSWTQADVDPKISTRFPR